MSVDVPASTRRWRSSNARPRGRPGKFGGGTVAQRNSSRDWRRRSSSATTRWSPTAGVVALLGRQAGRAAIDAGDDAIVILDATPFYAESGGQVGDTGELPSDAQALRRSGDTSKLAGQFHGHVGTLSAGTPRRRATGWSRRSMPRASGATILNHSATHLLHAALRSVLGTHVQQKGSLVAPDRLRFDFAHFQPVTRPNWPRSSAGSTPRSARNHEGEVRHMAMQKRWISARWRCSARSTASRSRAALRPDLDRTVRRHPRHLCRRHRPVQDRRRRRRSAGVRRIEAVTGQGALDYVAGRNAGSARPRNCSAATRARSATSCGNCSTGRRSWNASSMRSRPPPRARPLDRRARVDANGDQGPRGAAGGLRRQGPARRGGPAQGSNSAMR